jgi:hypothetical protein
MDHRPDSETARQRASRQADEEAAEARADRRSQANEMMGMGAGIGALGVVTATAFGAVCPVCVVAAPALIGAGLYKRYRAREPKGDADAPPKTTDVATSES